MGWEAAHEVILNYSTKDRPDHEEVDQHWGPFYQAVDERGLELAIRVLGLKLEFDYAVERPTVILLLDIRIFSVHVVLARIVAFKVFQNVSIGINGFLYKLINHMGHEIRDTSLELDRVTN